MTSGRNPMDLKRGIEQGAKAIVEELDEHFCCASTRIQALLPGFGSAFFLVSGQMVIFMASVQTLGPNEWLRSERDGNQKKWACT